MFIYVPMPEEPEDDEEPPEELPLEELPPEEPDGQQQTLATTFNGHSGGCSGGTFEFPLQVDKEL